jgi:hypothetical protein
MLELTPKGMGIVINPGTIFSFIFPPEECDQMRATWCKGVPTEPNDGSFIPADPKLIEALSKAVHPASGRR